MTPPYRNGLVIGKFYPPHAGHHYLIDEAAKRCQLLTVLVLAHPNESIPLHRRIEWLAERHPNVSVVGRMDPHPVDYDDPAVWQLHIDLIVDMIKDGEMWRPDAVFGSEPYVPELATRLEEATRHNGLVLMSRYTRRDEKEIAPLDSIIIDQPRQIVPVGGTAVRKNPAAYWWALTPAVRAYLTKRVVIMGAESTGTTTLTRALAKHYNTVWVPEYGRYFSEGVGKDYRWQSEDFKLIAAEQNRQEDELARRAGPIMFCDTDARATTIWHERYMRFHSSDLDELVRNPDMYLVTSAKNVPWEDDGTRDGEGEREWMSDRFWDVAWKAKNLSFWIEGPLEQRLHQTINHCDDLLRLGWRFNDPPG